MTRANAKYIQHRKYLITLYYTKRTIKKWNTSITWKVWFHCEQMGGWMQERGEEEGERGRTGGILFQSQSFLLKTLFLLVSVFTERTTLSSAAHRSPWLPTSHSLIRLWHKGKKRGKCPQLKLVVTPDHWSQTKLHLQPFYSLSSFIRYVSENQVKTTETNFV